MLKPLTLAALKGFPLSHLWVQYSRINAVGELGEFFAL
jgi:hypothetical protein